MVIDPLGYMLQSPEDARTLLLGSVKEKSEGNKKNGFSV
jgi:hypothetical protein